MKKVVPICILATLLALSLVGCKTMSLNQKHSNIELSKIKESTFIIKPVSKNDISIINIKDFKKHFPELKTVEEGKQYFADLINYKMNRKADAILIPKFLSFEGYTVIENKDVNLKPNKDLEFVVNVPVEIKSPPKSVDADFVLIIEDIVYQKKSSVQFVNLNQVNNAEWLDLEFEYVVWDLKNNKAASFGKLSSTSDYLVYMDRSNWDKASGNLLGTLLPGSAFTYFKQ